MKMKINIRRKCAVWVLVILSFVYIFNPRVVSIDLRKIVDVLSYLFIFFELYKMNWKVKVSQKIKNILMPFALFLMYQFINAMAHVVIGGGNLVCVGEYVTLLIFLIRTALIVIALTLYMKDEKLNYTDWLFVIFACAIIQLVCVMGSLVVPSVRSQFLAWNLANSNSENIAIYSKYVTDHGYGLCENLYDSFGYIISLIICMMFVFGIENDRMKLIIISFICILMPALNSRTGILFCLVGMAITLLKYSKKIILQKGIRYIILFAIVLGVMAVAYTFVPEDTKEWVQSGYNDIFSLMAAGEKTGFFSAIIKGLSYPTNILFGAGASPDGLVFTHTDIGYVQCIWRYGIIGTVMILLSYANLFIKMYKWSNIYKYLKCYALCAGVIFFLYLYKLYSLGNMGANIIIFSNVGFLLLKDYDTSFFDNKNKPWT